MCSCAVAIRRVVANQIDFLYLCATIALLEPRDVGATHWDYERGAASLGASLPVRSSNVVRR
jgi:hypothetical protein